MSRKMVLNILTISLFLSAMIILVGVMLMQKRFEESNGLQNVSSQSTIQFVLKEYQGKLGLFRGNAETPYQTLDFDINYLGEYDRELLKRGIGVDTERELEILIEDYTS